MVRKSLALVAILIPLVAFAACGDDDDDDDTAASGAATEETADEATGSDDGSAASGSGETIDVSETEFQIDPANPTAQAGSVTFAITNDGEFPHNLEVEGNGVEEVSDTVEGGQSTDLTVDLEPGTYTIYCAIGDHREQGMEGELTVE
jgi:plastocyanin